MRNAKVQTVLVQLLAAAAFGASALTVTARADEYASPERTAAAVGHYARARSLLLQALDEFEQGRKIARPDLLLDSEEFRISVVSRAEELNRVLDPQPKVTRSGVRFKGSPDLIRNPREERTSAQFVTPSASASQSAGNSQADTTAGSNSRGALNEPKPEALPPPQTTEKPKRAKTAKLKKEIKLEPPAVDTDLIKVQPEEKAPEAKTEEPTAVSAERSTSFPTNSATAAAKQDQAAATAETEEDPEVKQAIEQAIKERLDRIKAETATGNEKH
jgi:hypothetical protein